MKKELIIGFLLVGLILVGGLMLLVGLFTRAKPTEIHVHEHKK